MTARFTATALTTSMVASFVFAAPHFARAADSSEVFEEVVVTAQKREQNVQDVPLAVQVLSGKALAEQGVENFADLSLVSPTLVIRQDVQPVNATVAIRGVGTNSFGIGVEPSTAVVVDDVPLAFQARAFADLSDIDRIEVLRGPQSTLYGKSASAGLINITTGAPTPVWHGAVAATGTTDEEKGVNGQISGPITQDLAFRIVANYTDFPGNVTNLFTGGKINGWDNFSTRGKLAWDPTDDLNILFSADYINGATTVGRPFIKVAPNANLRNIAAYTPSVWNPGVSFGPDNLDVWNDYETDTKYFDFGQSLKITYDLAGLTLMSITSHARFSMDDHQDSDESAIGAINNQQTGYFHNTQWTEELRVVSPAKERFRYTAGLFYSDVEYQRDFIRGPFFSLARWYTTEGGENDAAFGQAEFDLLPDLTLLGGLRYGREAIDYTFADRLAKTRFAGNNSETFVTYKVGPQYHLTDDIMLFAFTATGHKGQTYDLTTGFNLNRAEAGPVKPEKSTDYEVGARMQFLGHRLTVNPTLFLTDYDNFQAQGIQQLPDGTTNYRLANVGKLETKGIELDNSFRVDRDLTLGASGAYLLATMTSFPGAQCYPLQNAATGCVGKPGRQDESGFPAPDAPRWKITGNFDYAHGLGFAPYDWLLRGSYSYQSKVNYALSNDPQTIQKEYGILNLSTGIRDEEQHYEAIVFVDNVTNQHYTASLVNSTATYGNHLAMQEIVPRDFGRYAGIRVSAKF